MKKVRMLFKVLLSFFNFRPYEMCTKKCETKEMCINSGNVDARGKCEIWWIRVLQVSSEKSLCQYLIIIIIIMGAWFLIEQKRILIHTVSIWIVSMQISTNSSISDLFYLGPLVKFHFTGTWILGFSILSHSWFSV